MADCIFCEIVHKRMQSDMVYEDEELVAFRDINPQAPVHMLIVPRQHIESVQDVKADESELMGKMLLIAQKLAKNNKIDEGGYRLVLNYGIDGGQTVSHLHMHLIGGRRMTWPPG
jgi:histidine triad (HIT) family protein